jgi:hypothetical protein
MGQEAPIVLEERGGELVLAIHNYRGPTKNFWEYRTLSGPFYKGNVRCGLALEVASRNDFPSLEAFAAYMARAQISDSVSAENEREVVYEGGGEALSLRYSLWDLRVLERRINGEAYSPPPLEAPLVRQTDGAPIALGAATLDAGGSPAWLLADDERQVWVATKVAAKPGPLQLAVPGGSLEIDALAVGKVVWRAAEGCVGVWSTQPTGVLRLTGPQAMHILVNDEDVTSHLRQHKGTTRIYEP